MLTIRRSILHDCCTLKNIIRDEHAKEIERFDGISIERALVMSYSRSDNAYTFVLNDTLPVFMAGIARDTNGNGIIWGLGSDIIDSYKKEFIRIIDNNFDYFIKDFDYLYNFIDDSYEIGIRFVEWLGFEIGEAKPQGLNGELFRMIEWRKEWQHKL